MAANVICLASSKGGAGKTTITAALGALLSEIGKRVLMVDCDEGTHGLTLMYLSEVNQYRKYAGQTPSGVLDDLAETSVFDNLVQLKAGLFLFPAKFNFSDSEGNWLEADLESKFRRVVEEASSHFDFVLLDAQAGISAASRAAMSTVVCDTVVLVSEYDPLSNAGVERMKARLPSELDVDRTWILLNKLLPEFVPRFSEFLSVAKYLPPIPWTPDVVRAYSRRKLALDFVEGNQFTLAMVLILRELLDEADRIDLEDWVSVQAERLREPIAVQIQDAEELLFQLRKERSAVSPIFNRTNTISWLIKPTTASLFLLVVFVQFLDYFQILLVSPVFAFGTFAFLLIITILMYSAIWSSRYSEISSSTARLEEEMQLLHRIKKLKELASSSYEKIISNR